MPLQYILVIMEIMTPPSPEPGNTHDNPWTLTAIIARLSSVLSWQAAGNRPGQDIHSEPNKPSFLENGALHDIHVLSARFIALIHQELISAYDEPDLSASAPIEVTYPNGKLTVKCIDDSMTVAVNSRLTNEQVEVAIPPTNGLLRISNGIASIPDLAGRMAVSTFTMEDDESGRSWVTANAGEEENRHPVCLDDVGIISNMLQRATILIEEAKEAVEFPKLHIAPISLQQALLHVNIKLLRFTEEYQPERLVGLSDDFLHDLDDLLFPLFGVKNLLRSIIYARIFAGELLNTNGRMKNEDIVQAIYDRFGPTATVVTSNYIEPIVVRRTLGDQTIEVQIAENGNWSIKKVNGQEEECHIYFKQEYGGSMPASTCTTAEVMSGTRLKVKTLSKNNHHVIAVNEQIRLDDMVPLSRDFIEIYRNIFGVVLLAVREMVEK